MNDKGKYNSVTMAKYIAAVANDRLLSINMTKIQKLLYIAYGLYLAVSNARLVNEHPQAWPYGPVFPTTRNKLLRINIHAISLEEEDFKELKEDDELQGLINLVFRSFGDWSASELTEWSHKPDSPWEHTVNVEGFKWGNQMDDYDIMTYFKSIIYDTRSI